MKLCGQIVKHEVLGEGKIVEVSNDCVTVLFFEGNQEKRFAYPSAFGAFLEAENGSFLSQIQKDKKAAVQEQVQREIARDLAAQARAAAAEAKAQKSSSRGKSKKTLNNSNIAFKCNYCDGGSGEETVGYKGVCSDDIIKYNTNVAKHVWCRESQCHGYMDGTVSRRELEVLCNEQEFICYESQMLREWRAYAGIVQNGANKGKPMTLRQARANSLAVLTTRLPAASDAERFIFAVFLIDQSYEGGSKDEGFVAADPKYRIQLSLDEAKQLKFWDYYYNQNRPEKIVFGSGLHRYLTDVQSAQVLQKICEIKKGSPQEELSNEFFKHYCRIKNLDVENIPLPNGALQR